MKDSYSTVIYILYSLNFTEKNLPRDQKVVKIGRLHQVFRCDNNELGSACVSPAGDGESPEEQPGGDQCVERRQGAHRELSGCRSQ